MKTSGYESTAKEGPHCLECGDVMPYGETRANKKFCCTKCKNDYHNKEVRDMRALHARYIRLIEKNYSILSNLIKMGITSMSRAQLASLGFNFSYMTSSHRVGAHDENMCYDIQYSLSSMRIFGLKRNFAFTDSIANAVRAKELARARELEKKKAAERAQVAEVLQTTASQDASALDKGSISQGRISVGVTADNSKTVGTTEPVIKRKRGRPRKYPLPASTDTSSASQNATSAQCRAISSHGDAVPVASAILAASLAPVQNE